MKQLSTWYQKYRNWMNHPNTKKYVPYILLVLILVIALFLRVKFLLGTERVDTLKYTQAAYNLLHGQYYTQIWEFSLTRLTMMIPTAFFYWIFGISEWSSVAWIILSQLIGILAVFGIGKFINTKVGLLAAFLTALYALEVSSGSRLLPDGLSLMSISMSIYLFLLADKNKINWRKILLFVFSGCFWALSYYTKVNLALVFPFFVLSYMVFNKKFRWDFGFVFVGFAIVWLSAGCFFYSQTGDFILKEHQQLFIHKYNYASFAALEGQTTTLNNNITNEELDTVNYNGVRDVERGYLSKYIWRLGLFYKAFSRNEALYVYLIASVVALVLLLASRNRRDYRIAYIIFVGAWGYELFAKFLSWGVVNDRYLTTLTVATVIIIASALYEIIRNKKIIGAILVAILMIIYCKISLDRISFEYKQHQRPAGYFYITQRIVAQTDIKNWQGNIIVPKGNWNRALNIYLDFNNTGYNWFDPASEKTSRLRDYTHAGATNVDGKYKFTDDDRFVLNSYIIRRNHKDELDLSNYDFKELWQKSFFNGEDISLLKITNAKN